MSDIEKMMQCLSVAVHSKTFRVGLNPVFTVRQVKGPITLLGTTPTNYPIMCVLSTQVIGRKPPPPALVDNPAKNLELFPGIG